MKSRVLFQYLAMSLALGASLEILQAEEAKPKEAKPKVDNATGLVFSDEWELSGFADQGDNETKLTFRELNGKRNIQVVDDDGLLTLRTLHMSVMGPVMEEMHKKFSDNGGKIIRNVGPVPPVAVQLADGVWSQRRFQEVKEFPKLQPTILSALDKWSKATQKALRALELDNKVNTQDYQNLRAENQVANQLYSRFSTVNMNGQVLSKDTATYEDFQYLSWELNKFLNNHSYTDAQNETFKLNDKLSEHPLAQLFTSRPFLMEDKNVLRMTDDRQDLVIGLNVLQAKNPRMRRGNEPRIPEGLHDGTEGEGPVEDVTPEAEVTDRGDLE